MGIIRYQAARRMGYDEELTQLEPGEDGAASEFGEIVLVAMRDARDDAVDAEAFGMT